jgi:hypothetical protein
VYRCRQVVQNSIMFAPSGQQHGSRRCIRNGRCWIRLVVFGTH